MPRLVDGDLLHIKLPLVGFQHLRHDRCMGAIAGRSTGRDDKIGPISIKRHANINSHRW